ncbi:MAG: prepilin-type N-terminal cleavage/methylation domain-containing protein [Planctomycetota bacterium]
MRNITIKTVHFMKRSGRGGFTLIELLVALLLTGLIMTSVFGVLHDAMSARDHIHNVSQIQRTGPMILDMIEADLRSISPFNVGFRRVFNGRKSSIGGADADVFDFVAMRKSASEIEVTDGVLGRERFLNSQLSEIGYRLKQNKREPVFLELWRREDMHLDEDPFNGGGYTRVYDKITNFKVTYFPEVGAQSKAEDHWSTEEQQMFPHRMKIEFELEIEPRIEKTNRPLEFSRRRSFARVFNINPDVNRVLVANARPLIPDVPKADDSAGGPSGGGPGGPGDANNTQGFSSGGAKPIPGLPFNSGNKGGGLPVTGNKGNNSGGLFGGGGKGNIGGLPGALPGGGKK